MIFPSMVFLGKTRDIMERKGGISMPIEIRPILPGDAERFVDYFDRLDFAHAREWKGCYCRYYHHAMDLSVWISRTPETNRNEAMESIQSGKTRGFLAFDGEKCVGWLNGGPLDHYPRLTEWLLPFSQGRKFAVTICFVIDPEYRGKGLARAMLAHAIESFRDHGLEGAFALPVSGDDGGNRRYRGTMHMYQEAGYREIGTFSGAVLMQKDW